MCLDSPILNVLIVDDELPIREELRSFDWRSHGACLIGECDNGSDALEFCCNNFPDVVISDIEMPVSASQNYCPRHTTGRFDLP